MIRSISTRIRLAGMLLTVTIGLGCGDTAPPKPKNELPKDMIRLEPEPADADAVEEFTTTESGLKYRIRRKSDGKKPEPTDFVRIHYRACLSNGAIFGSSYGKFGAAEFYQLDKVIKGWAEGMQLIGEGGMIELNVPPELAYGEEGFPTSNPPVPPNETLNIIVELLEVLPRPASQATSESKSENASDADHKHHAGHDHHHDHKHHSDKKPTDPSPKDQTAPDQKPADDVKKE